MTAGSRSSPAMTSAGSPGNRCCNRKIRTDTKNSVGISCRMRLPRKFSRRRTPRQTRRSQILRTVLARSLPPPLWGRDRESGGHVGSPRVDPPPPPPPPPEGGGGGGGGAVRFPLALLPS